METIFVGVAGGTGSGKTTVARNIVRNFNQEVTIIKQDSYYKDLSDLPFNERKEMNFDHPDAIDFKLLINHLKKLKKSIKIKKPKYNFKTHLRELEGEMVEPKKIIIVEGILIFAIPELMKLFDMKLFVDTDEDIRLLRRIGRDIDERDRTFESIKKQYLTTVKPMYLEFVEPSKRYADIIIPRGGKNKIAIKMVVAKLKSLL
ncbi:MAG: uridine kinase [Fusobacteriota bacterium]